mmetsp:Transcript_24155/g.70880  ORF Transcript_24155/g.70880 Transcript_24155/m.70880 type:complete len:244 (+) Transcript_24155:3039-3770(+)
MESWSKWRCRLSPSTVLSTDLSARILSIWLSSLLRSGAGKTAAAALGDGIEEGRAEPKRSSSRCSSRSSSSSTSCSPESSSSWTSTVPRLTELWSPALLVIDPSDSLRLRRPSKVSSCCLAIKDNFLALTGMSVVARPSPADTPPLALAAGGVARAMERVVKGSRPLSSTAWIHDATSRGTALMMASRARSVGFGCVKSSYCPRNRPSMAWKLRARSSLPSKSMSSMARRNFQSTKSFATSMR